MPQFISKLQYKNYEKGEFSEEKVRSQEDTISLIKVFPWDKQRGSDIQPTGPSVTIQNEDVEYLKIGLYFNGKFTAYFLDKNGHLFEQYLTDIDSVLEIVVAFFNNSLNLESFETHLFNVGYIHHFETNYFEYRVKIWKVLMLSAFMLFYLCIFITGVIASANIGSPVTLIPIAGTFLLVFVIIKILLTYLRSRNMYLQLSKGCDTFSFGMDKDHINIYNKKDIHEVKIYESRGSRNPNLIALFEIVFKDGTSIQFSNMLISSIALSHKFPEEIIVRSNKNTIWNM